MTIKPLYKAELARMADVSLPTIRKWLKREESQIIPLGYVPKDRLLPASVVEYMCNKYVIVK